MLRDPALAALLVALLVLAWSMSYLVGGTINGAEAQPTGEVTWSVNGQ